MTITLLGRPSPIRGLLSAWSRSPPPSGSVSSPVRSFLGLEGVGQRRTVAVAVGRAEQGELNYEKIAALQPDLILGVYSGITPREYELLSQIAPTVAQTDEYIDFDVPWQVQTRTMGRALGREQQVEDLVVEVEAQFAAVRKAHPEWEGQTVAVAVLAEDEQFSTFASEDPRSRFFTSLGFQVPAEIDELAGDRFYVDVSSHPPVGSRQARRVTFGRCLGESRMCRCSGLTSERRGSPGSPCTPHPVSMTT